MIDLQKKIDLKSSRAKRAAKLQQAWGFENRFYKRDQWRRDVGKCRTILGYWEWVGVCIDLKDVGMEDT